MDEQRSSADQEYTYRDLFIGLFVFTIFLAGLGALIVMAGGKCIELLIEPAEYVSLFKLAGYGALAGAGVSIFYGMMALIIKKK